MILNNHKFNLYIRSWVSHLGPRHRLVLQMERQMAHVQSKATLRSSVRISKESKRDRSMQFGQSKPILYSSFGSEQHICVFFFFFYINMLHRDESPLQVTVPPSHWFCVCACGGSDPTAGLARQRPPSHCRVTESADKSSWQLLHPH